MVVDCSGSESVPSEGRLELLCRSIARAERADV